ncbi:hypothetical protein FS837_007933 [Tulasnella sp. UAMH 9824]|nr:hypothetical protein FS837_007933 [Tulasnella sp. UAMH 9824]
MPAKKRGHVRKEGYGAQLANLGCKARGVRLGEQEAKEEPETAKKPVETDDLNQERYSTGSFSDESPRKKRARPSPSDRLEPPVAQRSGSQAKVGEAILARGPEKEPSLLDPDDKPLPGHQLAGHLPSIATPATGPSSKNEPDDSRARGDFNPSEAAHSSAQSTSQSESEPSPLAYIYAPHPNFWIPFGRLQCIQNPRVHWSLAIQNDGRLSRPLLVGYGQGCEIVVFGPNCGIRPYHCELILELEQSKGTPTRRRVVVSKIDTIIASPSAITTVSEGEKSFVLEDKLILPPGGVIQFGTGERYRYEGAEFDDLYSRQSRIYGIHNTNSNDNSNSNSNANANTKSKANSSVLRVQRRSDELPFVAKVILHSRRRMAEVEIEVYKVLRHHPRIVQFIEAIYDSRSMTHHLILEAGSTDLYRHVKKLRPSGQNLLRMQAPRWIKEVTCGIAYIHQHGIAHRDIKPENLLVFVADSGCVTLKVMDMGIARRSTEPVIPKASIYFLKDSLLR